MSTRPGGGGAVKVGSYRELGEIPGWLFDNPDRNLMAWYGVMHAETSLNASLVGLGFQWGHHRLYLGDSLALLQWDGTNLKRLRTIEDAYHFGLSPDGKQAALLEATLCPNWVATDMWHTLEKVTLSVMPVGGERRKLAEWKGSKDERLDRVDVRWDTTGAWIAVMALPFDAMRRTQYMPGAAQWRLVRASDGRTFDADIPGRLVKLTASGRDRLVATALTFDPDTSTVTVRDTTIAVR